MVSTTPQAHIFTAGDFLFILVSCQPKECTSDSMPESAAEPLKKPGSASVLDMDSSETHQSQSKPGVDVFAGVNALLAGCDDGAPPNKDDIISPRGFAA